MATKINRKELVRLFESEGATKGSQVLQEGLAAKELKLDDLSIRDLFEAAVVDDHGKPCGRDILYEMDPRRGALTVRALTIQEARGAVDTSAFNNITGQFVYNKIKESYDDPEFIGDELCTTQDTFLIDGEKIPGAGNLGDVAQVVAEREEYPYVGLNEEWTMTPPTDKRGFIVPVTREIIMLDKTGLVVAAAQKTGRAMGLNKEKRVLDVVFGVVNTYNRNGTATNTYLTSGAYINQTSNTLSDWTSIQTAELLFDAITDPNTGEPITGSIDTIIVPTALRRTANRILMASEIAHVDNQVAASTIRTWSRNPYSGETYRVISSPYVKQRTTSASTWFAGRPKRAFLYMQNWGIETLQAAQNSEADFLQDIVSRYKVSERGAAHSYEPRYMTKNT